MTSKPIELRQVILDSVCCCGDDEQATDAILDAVIASLPKEENISARDEGSQFLNYGKGFNDALDIVKRLLEQAKELPTTKETK